MTLNERLKQKLLELENSPEHQRYFYHSEIKSILAEDEPRTLEFNSEVVAFLVIDKIDSKSPWAPFYDYFMVMKGQASPSHEYISEKAMKYWRSRSLQTSNLIMKERYLGLYTSLYSQVFSQKRPPNIEYAKLLLKVIKNIHNKNDNYTFENLRKLLHFCYQNKLESKIMPKLTPLLIVFIENSPGLAYQLYTDNLLKSKKLKEILRNKTIEIFKESLNTETNPHEINEHLSGMLELSIQKDILKECIEKYIDFLDAKQLQSQADEDLNLVFILDGVMSIIHKAYSKQVLLDNKKVIKLKKSFHKCILQYINSGTPHTFSQKISMKKTIEDFKNINNVPDILKLYISENVLLAYSTYLKHKNKKDQTYISDLIPSLNFDSGDYRTRHKSTGQSSIRMTLTMTIMQSSYLVLDCLNRTLDLNYTKIASHFLTDNAVFNFTDHSKALETILDHYYKQNYLEVMCIAPPLIEYYFKELLEHANYDITTGNPNDRVKLKSLSTLLNKQNGNKPNKEYLKVESALKSLYPTDSEVYIEAALFYLNYVLNDFQGMNLRNNIAHGLVNKDYFDSGKASAILSCLLLILILQKALPTN